MPAHRNTILYYLKCWSYVIYYENLLVYKFTIVSDSSTALLLVVLMLFQNLRRLYECVCVSVFSDSRMNLFHYGAGLLLYASFHVAVVVEGPELKHYVDFKGLSCA